MHHGVVGVSPAIDFSAAECGLEETSKLDVGVGHEEIRSDRVIRSVVSVMSSIVLNAGAVGIVGDLTWRAVLRIDS